MTLACVVLVLYRAALAAVVVAVLFGPALVRWWRGRR